MPLLMLAAVLASGIAALPPCSDPSARARRLSASALACPGCSVLFLDLDGLRADRFDRLPFLGSLARRGVSFRNAVAQAPWTYPSVVSVATSHYPSVHGVGSAAEVAGPKLPTVFDAFTRAGYRVFGRDQRPFIRVDGRHAMAVEENSFDDPAYTAGLSSAAALLASGPAFAYVINLDMHAPYVRRGEAAELSVEAAYDRRARRLDDRVRAFFGELERGGALARTVVFVYANHGELLFEHSLELHGFGYEPEAHVPLVMIHPRLPPEGLAVCEIVQLIDLAPTGLELAGLPARLGRGRSLAPLIAGAVRDGRFRYGFTEASNMGAPRKSIRSMKWKLMRADGREELYDLEADPGETLDLSRERPGVARELSARLAGWESSNFLLHFPRRHEPTEREKTELRLHGYWRGP
jgi:arylsulfatase A-like enzyme